MKERYITVCAECLQAPCWQAIFMCDKSRNADVVRHKEPYLRKLDREHPDYMLTDEELANDVKPGQQVRP